MDHEMENTQFTETRIGICRSTQKSPPLTLLTDSCNTHSLPALLTKHQVAHSLPSDLTQNARCQT